MLQTLPSASSLEVQRSLFHKLHVDLTSNAVSFLLHAFVALLPTPHVHPELQILSFLILCDDLKLPFGYYGPHEKYTPRLLNTWVAPHHQMKTPQTIHLRNLQMNLQMMSCGYPLLTHLDCCLLFVLHIL